MAKVHVGLLMLLASIGLLPRTRLQPTTDVIGVWRTVEARDAAGKDITDRGQRTIFIFTRRHFSIAWSDIVRPQFGPPLSDAQKVAMWQGFGAQEGTYEASGDTLILRSEIAKSPRAMAPGAFQKFTVQLQSGMMWVKLVADSSGSLPNQERIRLIRLE